MTEKNAVKSETVSPAREWEDTEVDLSENMVTFRNGTAFLPLFVDGKWKDVSFAEVLTAYASHVSSLSSGAATAREWIKTQGLRDDVPYRLARLESLLDAYDAHVSQAIGPAAKEAAEKIARDLPVKWEDSTTDEERKLGTLSMRSLLKAEEVEAIILAAIEKARTK